ncbi:MAG: hypothetical protein KDC35_02235 [Acidobacteria bacterium]|nr:hypothetical protein [Acidobacteriota bacterium]
MVGLLCVVFLFGEAGNQAHTNLFDEKAYPRASDCGNCHPDHYKEWSVSPHAYAVVSPVFNAMHKKINALTSGSNADFCIRCHTPVGMQMGESPTASIKDRAPVAREAVTCIVCHRVTESYGKVSGRQRIQEGPLEEPIVGPTGDKELQRALQSGDYRMTSEPGEPGRLVHQRVIQLETMSDPGFCGMCHDVNFVNGFRLEEAFSEFKTSPAARRGETCVDCHMGPNPGVAGPFPKAPAANVNGVETQPRKRTNHMFMGPDYSVVHPAIFPHNDRAESFAKIEEWLQFDWEAGWGTDDFEDEDHDEGIFPERWKSIDDRYDARVLIDQNLALLEEAQRQRLEILKRGYQLGPLKVADASRLHGIQIHVNVTNGTDGHGVPTGFDAERLVFLRVEISNQDGRQVYVSGDLDSRGDLRDLHSKEVIDGHVPLDRDLFSLQSKFLTQMVRGGEREQVLAVNQSLSPLPFVRPAATPNILTGRPSGARKHKMNIEPLGQRKAEFHLKGPLNPGRYDISVSLISGMVPVNLVYEIEDAGFDYGLSAHELARRVVKGHSLLWQVHESVVVP